MSEEVFVGEVGDFLVENRRIVSLGDTEVGVFYLKEKDEFYAYENVCRHQGGPVCEGHIMGKVEVELDHEQKFIREKFSQNRFHLICPWHGVEYDITTGRCSADPNLRLRRFEVVQRGGKIYVFDPKE